MTINTVYCIDRRIFSVNIDKLHKNNKEICGTMNNLIANMQIIKEEKSQMYIVEY